MMAAYGNGTTQKYGRYRNLFLGETTKQIEAKSDSGEYKLVNLN